MIRAGVVSTGGLWSAGLLLLVGQVAEIVQPGRTADVIVWDLPLPELVDRRILVIGDDTALLKPLRAQAIGGVITRQATADELVVAVRAVARGEMFLHPALTAQFLNPPEPRRLYFETPTPREADVLRRVVRGYTNKQTAAELGISVRTVESHRANLMDKLNIRSRRGLVRYAQEADYT